MVRGGAVCCNHRWLPRPQDYIYKTISCNIICNFSHSPRRCSRLPQGKVVSWIASCCSQQSVCCMLQEFWEHLSHYSQLTLYSSGRHLFVNTGNSSGKINFLLAVLVAFEIIGDPHFFFVTLSINSLLPKIDNR